MSRKTFIKTTPPFTFFVINFPTILLEYEKSPKNSHIIIIQCLTKNIFSSQHLDKLLKYLTHIYEHIICTKACHFRKSRWYSLAANS